MEENFKESDIDEDGRLDFRPAGSYNSDPCSHSYHQRNLSSHKFNNNSVQVQQTIVSQPVSVSSLSNNSPHQTTIHFLQNQIIKPRKKSSTSNKSSIFLPSTNHNFKNINEIENKSRISSYSIPQNDTPVKLKTQETAINLVKDSPGLTLYAYLLNNSSPSNTETQQVPYSSRPYTARTKISSDQLEIKNFVPRFQRLNSANQIINNAVVYNTDNYLRSIIQVSDADIADFQQNNSNNLPDPRVFRDSNELKLLSPNKTPNLISSNNSDTMSRSSHVTQFRLTNSKLNSNQFF